MHKAKYAFRSCKMRACGYQLDPLEVCGTIKAGEVCGEGAVQGEAEEKEDCLLATAFIAEQTYKAGYHPCETLAQGTLFPELVRPYM